jgi:hypothetical protein
VAELVRGEADQHNPTEMSRPHDCIRGAHLRRTLGKYAVYYNELRIHRSLDKDAPSHREIERLGAITSQAVLGGLHHQLQNLNFRYRQVQNRRKRTLQHRRLAVVSSYAYPR